MAKLKPIKDEKEMAQVPLDEPLLVELEPAATGLAAEPEHREERREEPEDDGSKALKAQLEASQNAERRERDLREAAERDATAAREETERLKSSGADTEKELLTNSLAGAQARQAAAKAKFKTAFQAGDDDAMADAQADIGRAAAEVLQFEGAIAQFDEDAKREPEKPAPKAEESTDIVTAIDRDPKLMGPERDWLKAHTEVLTDSKLNRRLASAYDDALDAGHKRGTPAYFKFLDQRMGYAKAADDDDGGGEERTEERASIVSAPVSRDSRSSLSGRPQTPTRVMLSPAEREAARNMGVSDAAYAKGKLQLAANKSADPERYSGRQ